MSTNAPSQPPDQKPDLWREQLKTLADRNRLTFISEEHQDQQGPWWSYYYLTNPDGSKCYYLGSHSGQTKKLAKEYAAKQSYGTLITFIDTWIKNAAETSAASTSAAVNTYSAPGSFWEQALNKLAKDNNLRFVLKKLRDPQGTWWATYHLINPDDGSKHSPLGYKGATASNLAVEYAAHEAFETLTCLIEAWTQPGTAAGPSGAGGSSG